MDAETDEHRKRKLNVEYYSLSDKSSPRETQHSDDDDEEEDSSDEELETQEKRGERAKAKENRKGIVKVGTQEQLEKTTKRISQRERQRRRNFGESYVTATGKVVEAKIFQNTNCNCKNKCIEKVPVETREETFKNFWKIGNYSAQNVLICGLVQQAPPDRRRPRGSGTKAPKLTTNRFYLALKDGTKVKVCKRFFLDTYQISDGRMSRALKMVFLGESPADRRGKHTPANKIPEEQMIIVRQHILSFPSYQSQYTREWSQNHRNLPEQINIRWMYNMYRMYCDEQNIPPVKEHIYRRTFNSEFNLLYVDYAEAEVSITEIDKTENTIDNKISNLIRNEETLHSIEPIVNVEK